MAIDPTDLLLAKMGIRSAKHTFTSENGDFQLEHLLPGELLRLGVAAEGFAGYQSTERVTVTDEQLTITLLANTDSLTGQVVDNEGAVIAHALIWARRSCPIP